ncbi:hypothetical protein [Sphingomonas sp.]|jgi:hypothetical protein|uniref:hypothetical protein n=1 Tax=Sphingomonas sp. TaxID=28214 RepID=UPI002DE37DCB|nr:hypothetical protein [Sphingomonas sp.]
MTGVIAFVDLDDTLFQTRGKCPPSWAEADLTPLGFARDGAALSYATPRQLNFLEWLARTTMLIPVTGRSRDALTRAHVPHRAAICAHGGVILGEDGTPDGEWAERMAVQAAAHGELLGQLVERIRVCARERGEPLAVRVLEEAGMPLYVLAKHDAADAERLHAVIRAAVPVLPPGWTLHLNGNNAALLPPHLGKQHAVAWMLGQLRARHPNAAVVGIGDSLTDAPFMKLCDFAMLPPASQLGERLFDAG